SSPKALQVGAHRDEILADLEKGHEPKPIRDFARANYRRRPPACCVAQKAPARAGANPVAVVMFSVTSAAPRTKRRCPCGPDPWSSRTAAEACLRAVRGGR